MPVDIRIGIANNARELSFETSLSVAEVEQTVADSLGGGSPFIKLTDDKGRVFLVPTASLAYIEVGAEEARRVGFVA